jgi:hypothetical protein
MTIFQSTLLVFFAIIFYLIAVDKNVEDYIVLTLKLIKINVQRFFWLIRLNPIWYDNPIYKWKKDREYAKIIQELTQQNNQEN